MPRSGPRPLDAQLTAEEAASILGLSRWQIYRQLAAGIIPSRRVGRKYLIFKADVERMLTQGSQPADVGRDSEFRVDDLRSLLAGEELVFEVTIRLKRPTQSRCGEAP